MGPGSAKSMPSTAEPETPNPTDASSAASGATSSFPRLGSLILKINTKTHPNHTARYVSAYVPGDQGPWDIHSHPCTASGTFRPGGSGEATAASFTVPQDRLFLKAKGLADPDWVSFCFVLSHGCARCMTLMCQASATLGTFHEVVDGNPSETPSDAPIFDDWRISVSHPLLVNEKQC